MPIEPLSVIVSACRTPIGAFGGSLKDVSAADLGGVVIREALTRASVEPAGLDDVIMGCVLQGGAGMNVARQAAIKAGVPPAVPAETVNRVCGSSLQAVVHATEATRVYAQVVVAGGTESMSQAPYLLPQARWGLRMGHGEIYDSMLGEGLRCAIERCHMGLTAEEVSRRFGISRADQDAFAVESQARAAAAIAAGAFREEIVPVPLAWEEGRPGGLRGRRASAAGDVRGDARWPQAGVHARGDRDARERLGHQRRRRRARRRVTGRSRRSRPPHRRSRLSYAVVGVEPIVMGLGPIGAVRLALGRAGLAVSDIASLRAQRGVCRTGPGRVARARSGRRAGERARRRDCAGPPDRRQRRAPPDHLDPCAARPRRRAGRRLSLHRRRDGIAS
jgi:acetyl-CoA C-acetyltransferase